MVDKIGVTPGNFYFRVKLVKFHLFCSRILVIMILTLLAKGVSLFGPKIRSKINKFWIFGGLFWCSIVLYAVKSKFSAFILLLGAANSKFWSYPPQKNKKTQKVDFSSTNACCTDPNPNPCTHPRHHHLFRKQQIDEFTIVFLGKKKAYLLFYFWN